MNKRTIAVVDWPWDRDKKKSENEAPKAKVKSTIADSMKMKRQLGSNLPLKRLKPISNIIRKENGEVNTRAVKNLIHSLEDILHKQARK